MKRIRFIFCLLAAGALVLCGCKNRTSQLDVYHGEEKIIAVAVTDTRDEKAEELKTFVENAFINSAETTIKPAENFTEPADYRIDLYPFITESGQDTVSIWISVDGEVVWFIRTGWAEMETKYVWQASCTAAELREAFQNYGQ